MESTGVYWKPIYNVLEEDFEVLLVNARHIKTVPGRKTDVKDCEWIAELMKHGLLRGSFVPARWQRELRDLTRHRRKLVQQRASVANRVQKVLEEANIKLGSVATDVLGVSGKAMLKAMVAGQSDPVQLAALAQRRLKQKKDELEKALEGHVREHHRFLLQQLMNQIDFLEDAIEKVSAKIEEKTLPFDKALQQVDGVPGLNRRAGEDLLAEIGVDMNQFPTAGHLASWAGICPGKDESAGRNRSGKTAGGNHWLRSVLTEAAWGASRTKRSYLKAQYHRLASKRGSKRAILAVGHSILVIVYHILKKSVPYFELGLNFFDQLHQERLTRSLVRRLERLGNLVTLMPIATCTT
jgi:transposase